MNRPLHYTLDESGEPTPCDDILRWGAWFERDERRFVRKVEFSTPKRGERVEVSTVFLGSDHNYRFQGPAVLWETMVFGGEQDGLCERYDSREAAIAGHNAIVASLGGPIFE